MTICLREVDRSLKSVVRGLDLIDVHLPRQSVPRSETNKLTCK